MLLAWRRLATQPTEHLLTKKSLGAVLEEFGHAPDDEAVGDLATELRRLSAGAMVGMLKDAFIAAERYGFGRAVGGWLADALVAQRLGWAYAVPLLGAEVNAAGLGTSRSRRAGGGFALASIEDGSSQVKSLLAGQARSALRAIDLSSELGRRAEKLLAVAPKLRAKAADIVVERLLSDDAIVASEQISRHERSRAAPPVRPFGRTRRRARAFRPPHLPHLRALTTMAEATRRRGKGRPDNGRSGDRLFDRELDHLPPEARWREWMHRVEATIFAASEPVGRETLARIVGKTCSIDLLIDDIREELCGRPYDLVAVAGGWKHLTRPAYADAIRSAFGTAVGGSGDAVDLTQSEVLVLMCIAYFQPITRAELSSFFGKEVSRDLIGHLRGAGFIASGPRSPTPGAPYTYVTTREFLLEFGLDTLRDLPDFEALEDAGLLSKEKLLAGEIIPDFVGDEGYFGVELDE